MRKLLAAFILCTLLPVWAVAECPPCDVPTGYENGIHNMTQLFVVVEGWEEEVEVMEQGPYEYCCCCFTTDYYSVMRPTEPIENQDCDGYNEDCMLRGNSLIWITETAALDNLQNRDDEGELSADSTYVTPWTRLEVSCNGSPWIVCPGSTYYGSAVLIFLPDCFDCP
jgi:hypothetical protein